MKANNSTQKGAIPELSNHAELLESVSEKLQRKWIHAYKNVRWINQELGKADLWLTASEKPVKNVGLFLTNWLGRATPPPASVTQLEDLSKYERDL